MYNQPNNVSIYLYCELNYNLDKCWKFDKNYWLWYPILCDLTRDKRRTFSNLPTDQRRNNFGIIKNCLFFFRGRCFLTEKNVRWYNLKGFSVKSEQHVPAQLKKNAIFNWFSRTVLTFRWPQSYEVSRTVISKFLRYRKSSFFFLTYDVLR